MPAINAALAGDVAAMNATSPKVAATVANSFRIVPSSKLSVFGTGI
jgi:hypothetical protein